MHGLLQGINSSFKFSEMGFNPSLTSSFSGYYFLCGNKCRSLNLATTGIAFGARPTDFPSAHTLGFTFCSIKGSEREDFIFMKTEAWTLLCISLPKCSEGDLARSETLVKIAQSPSCSLKNNNSIKEIILFGSSRQWHYESGLGRKWTRGFSKHRVSCPSV